MSFGDYYLNYSVCLYRGKIDTSCLIYIWQKKNSCKIWEKIVHVENLLFEAWQEHRFTNKNVVMFIFPMFKNTENLPILAFMTTYKKLSGISDKKKKTDSKIVKCRKLGYFLQYF